MENSTEKSSLRKAFGGVFMFILLLVIVIICGLFGARAFSAGYRFYPVKGISMQPYINPDIIMQSQIQDGAFVHVGQKPMFNDIVIIEHGGKDSTIIKRVLAFKGDYITIKKNTTDECMHSGSGCGYYHLYFYKDGKAEILNEQYVERYDRWTNEITSIHDSNEYYENSFYSTYIFNYATARYKNNVENLGGTYYYKLQNDEFFYMGDNRYCSLDGRRNGVAHGADIIGVVVSVVRDIVDEAKSTPDKVVYKSNIWWFKLKTSLSYFFGKITDYFDWKR